MAAARLPKELKLRDVYTIATGASPCWNSNFTPLMIVSGSPVPMYTMVDTGSTFGNGRITGGTGLIHIVVERNIKALALAGHFCNQQGIQCGCRNRAVDRFS